MDLSMGASQRKDTIVIEIKIPYCRCPIHQEQEGRLFITLLSVWD